MAPYLLFGFLAAAVSVLFLKPDFIERHMGAAGKFSGFKAALFGVPLPLCSCSVIPVAVSLREHGAGRGATIAFLISTPQTGIDSILVTYSLLGPVFTIMRPLAAFISGLAGGWLVDRFSPGKEGGADVSHAAARECFCCAEKPVNRIAAAMRYGFIAMPRNIGNALLTGLIISALISVLLPPNFLGHVMGSGLKPMLIMMVVAIPLYVCAAASVPVAAALILQGVTPGAAFVFLMAGPATNAATIATVWKTLGKKTALLYLLTVAVFSIIFGFAIDGLFAAVNISASSAPMNHAGLPLFVKNLSAVVLFVLIAAARLGSLWKKHET